MSVQNGPVIRQRPMLGNALPFDWSWSIAAAQFVVTLTKSKHAALRTFWRAGCACLIAVLGAASSHAQIEPRYTSLKEIRERGLVMQQWETSCAAATIATVLTYGLGDAVSEAHVVASMLKRTDAATVKKQGGFSLLDMKRFVEDRGYTGRGYKHLSFDDLKAFQAPIIPIDHYGFNHYVVFNGVKDGEVFLADPAFGNRKMSLQQFSRVWMDGMAFVVTANGKYDKEAD